MIDNKTYRMRQEENKFEEIKKNQKKMQWQAKNVCYVNFFYYLCE